MRKAQAMQSTSAENMPLYGKDCKQNPCNIKRAGSLRDYQLFFLAVPLIFMPEDRY
jgi:hypothetical protein